MLDGERSGMMRMGGMMVVFAAAGVLLAGWAGAQMSAVSDYDVPLDTRSFSSVAMVTDKEVDTRTYTADWSAARKLNTKKIIGTIILMR